MRAVRTLVKGFVELIKASMWTHSLGPTLGVDSAVWISVDDLIPSLRTDRNTREILIERGEAAPYKSQQERPRGFSRSLEISLMDEK